MKVEEGRMPVHENLDLWREEQEREQVRREQAGHVYLGKEGQRAQVLKLRGGWVVELGVAVGDDGAVVSRPAGVVDEGSGTEATEELGVEDELDPALDIADAAWPVWSREAGKGPPLACSVLPELKLELAGRAAGTDEPGRAGKGNLALIVTAHSGVQLWPASFWWILANDFFQIDELICSVLLDI